MNGITDIPYIGDERCSCGKTATIQTIFPSGRPWYRCQDCEDKINKETEWENRGASFDERYI